MQVHHHHHRRRPGQRQKCALGRAQRFALRQIVPSATVTTARMAWPQRRATLPSNCWVPAEFAESVESEWETKTHALPPDVDSRELKVPSGLRPSLCFHAWISSAGQLRRLRQELSRSQGEAGDCNRIDTSAILLTGALLLENDSCLRDGGGRHKFPLAQQRHTDVLAAAKAVAERDPPRAHLLSIFVFLLGRRHGAAAAQSSSSPADASAAAEYKLSLLECLPSFGTHAAAVPLLRRLLSPLLLRPSTCAVAIRIFTDIWKERQQSVHRTKSSGSLFPVLERILEDHCEARELYKMFGARSSSASFAVRELNRKSTTPYVGEILRAVSESALLVCTLRPGLGGQIIGVLQRLVQCEDCGSISGGGGGGGRPCGWGCRQRADSTTCRQRSD